MVAYAHLNEIQKQGDSSALGGIYYTFNKIKKTGRQLCSRWNLFFNQLGGVPGLENPRSQGFFFY
jgi:hypothetical protein